jgi:hypothetical protein
MTLANSQKPFVADPSPAPPMRGASRSNVALLALLISLFYLCQTGNAGAISVDNYLITDDPKGGTNCSTPSAVTVVSPESEGVFFWVLFSDASTSDAREWRWMAPDNSLYYSAQGTFSFNGPGCAWSGIYVKGAEASSLLGKWHAELYLNGVLSASKSFYIGVPQPPVISFSPQSGCTLTALQAFDFSFTIDFGLYPELYDFSISYMDCDITQLFLSLLVAEYAEVSIQQNVISVTLPGLALPSGEHRVAVMAKSPGGTAVSDWTVTVSPPQYTLSDDQKDLMAHYGNPSYLTIAFSDTPKRREEAWTYIGLKKMYIFWDGARVGETTITVHDAAYKNPPKFDPSLFTSGSTLQDLIQIIGSGYTEVDQSGMGPAVGSADFHVYHFSSRGLFVSFLNNRLVVVKSIDIPKEN